TPATRARRTSRTMAAPRASPRSHLGFEVCVECVEECLGRQMTLVRADQHGEVLRHLARLDRLDAHLLERVGELHDVGRTVELTAVLEALRPREDRGDRIRRRGLALLMLAEVAR